MCLLAFVGTGSMIFFTADEKIATDRTARSSEGRILIRSMWPVRAMTYSEETQCDYLSAQRWPQRASAARLGLTKYLSPEDTHSRIPR